MRARSLLLLAFAALACSNLPAAEPPPPPVAPTPPELAGLTVHVFQMVHPPLGRQDEWEYHNMPGYNADLRRLFAGQLARAGYTVITDRSQPASLIATVYSDMPYEHVGVATLVLTHEGAIVERISVPVELSGKPGKTVHHAEAAAVSMVDATTKSPRIAALAHRLRTAVASATTTVECPPEASFPPEPTPPSAECIFEPVARCTPPAPVRSAWQPEPFTGCPREIAAFADSLLDHPAQFSAQATRAQRLGGTCAPTPAQGDCCYVQFTTRVCR